MVRLRNTKHKKVCREAKKTPKCGSRTGKKCRTWREKHPRKVLFACRNCLRQPFRGMAGKNNSSCR